MLDIRGARCVVTVDLVELVGAHQLSLERPGGRVLRDVGRQLWDGRDIGQEGWAGNGWSGREWSEKPPLYMAEERGDEECGKEALDS